MLDWRWMAAAGSYELLARARARAFSRPQDGTMHPTLLFQLLVLLVVANGPRCSPRKGSAIGSPSRLTAVCHCPTASLCSGLRRLLGALFSRFWRLHLPPG